MSSPEDGGAGGAAGVTTIVHLVRHGEVHNPGRVLYGRLPGFHLSQAGRGMARAAAAYLAGRDVTVVRASPMERAQETAEPIAAEFGLPVTTDERLIEADSHFEGQRVAVGDGVLRKPQYWVYLWNPLRPSWGEPYVQIAERVLAAVADAAADARGHEAVCISHQLPICTARRSAEGRRLWHDPRGRECSLGSVTTLTLSGDRVTGVQYHEPSGAGRPQVPGA